MVTYVPLDTTEEPSERAPKNNIIFRNVSLRLFLLLLTMSLPILYYIYINLEPSIEKEKHEIEFEKHVKLHYNESKIHEIEFEKHVKLLYNESKTSNDLRYILLWTTDKASPFYYLGKGQEAFKRNKCEFTNCFVTSDRTYLEGNITKFDAIAFNGRNMRYTKQSELPQERSPAQKYIFFNLESSTYQPVCNPWYDGFFNWTSSYKLSSDIVYSYIHIRNTKGESVGPRIDMEWINDMKDVDDNYKKKLQSKEKAAAWFVSHCITRSKREKYVKSLQQALAFYNMTVDVYGNCGTNHCPRSNEKYCYRLIEKKYYFYLSFENAFAEDYVTEKLLTGLQHDAVPIVYGGANYSRFLPPGSYLDARMHEPEELAAIMAHLIATPSEYHKFFKWRNHYSYSESEAIEDVCNVCTALNNQNMVLTPFVYDHFRSWWNPDFEERCQDDNWST